MSIQHTASLAFDTRSAVPAPSPDGLAWSGTPELAIVLPTLNERDNVAGLVARLEEALGPTGWEAIIVDDNSADDTAGEARRIARNDPRIRVIQRFGRRGLASAAIEGMCSTAAPFVAVMDADHQHDPALLPDMLEAVRSGAADIAIASRFAEGGSAEGLSSAARHTGSHFANLLARRVTGLELTDPMSGYFMLPTEHLRRLAPKLSGIGFKILFDILAASPKPIKPKEFSLKFAKRQSGESKLDEAVAFEFLVGIYDRAFGHIIPTRFALFGLVGAMGVVVHMAVLGFLHLATGREFLVANSAAILVAMSFNFLLNNLLTYRDQRLRSKRALAKGWIGFCLTCSIGGIANATVASLLEGNGAPWVLAALAGIAIGSVWNYALSSRFVWGKIAKG